MENPVQDEKGLKDIFFSDKEVSKVDTKTGKGILVLRKAYAQEVGFEEAEEEPDCDSNWCGSCSLVEGTCVSSGCAETSLGCGFCGFKVATRTVRLGIRFMMIYHNRIVKKKAP